MGAEESSTGPVVEDLRQPVELDLFLRSNEIAQGPKVAVVASAKFEDEAVVVRALEELEPAVIIEGEGTGEQAVKTVASSHGVAVAGYPMRPERYGAEAGPVRDAAIIGTAPDVLVIFGSRRARHVQNLEAAAAHAGIPVLVATKDGTRGAEAS